MKTYVILCVIISTLCLSCKTKEISFDSREDIYKTLKITNKWCAEGDKDFVILLWVTHIGSSSNYMISIENTNSSTLLTTYKYGIKKHMFSWGSKKYSKSSRYKLSDTENEILLQLLKSSKILDNDVFCNNKPCDNLILDALHFGFEIYTNKYYHKCGCTFDCNCTDEAMSINNFLTSFLKK